MPFGPLMLDLAGTDVTPEERELLKHPLVGGVILFTRNYESPEQLFNLTHTLHTLRQPPLLIAVDHEGGRVQRFRQHFTALPDMAKLGALYDKKPKQRKQTLKTVQEIGWLLAAELRALGIDFSFTPVLDLNSVTSEVMHQRTFHANPDTVSNLASALMGGMRQAGMVAVGKHFPGHGSVSADSHKTLPVDTRSYADIRMSDLVPFARLIEYGLAAIMPAHVVYSQVDAQPAGFSEHWLKTILRDSLHFQGMIFSDDLNMAGAAIAGEMPARVEWALAAGCDMLLICNNRPSVIQVLDTVKLPISPVLQVRAMRMHGQNQFNWDSLHRDTRCVNAQHTCQVLMEA